MRRWDWFPAIAYTCTWPGRGSYWSQQDAVAELRALASDVPKSRSFVEGLLAERRLAAATE